MNHKTPTARDLFIENMAGLKDFMENDTYQFYKDVAIRCIESHTQAHTKELRERVKELEAIVGETYNPSRCNEDFLQWVDKYFAIKPRVQWFFSMSTSKRYTIKEIEQKYEQAILESPLINKK